MGRLEMVNSWWTALIVWWQIKYEHITPVLRDILHWLPVPQRIQFKYCSYCIRCAVSHTSSTSAYRRRISLVEPVSVLPRTATELDPQMKFQRRCSCHLEQPSRPFALVLHLQRTVLAWTSFSRLTINLWEPCVQECIELNWTELQTTQHRNTWDRERLYHWRN